MAVNEAQLAFAAWQAEEEKARQRAVVMARRYHDGLQDTFMTERMRQFLNVSDSYEFNLNVCRLVVEVIAERLIVVGPTTDEQAGQAGGVREWAEAVWAGVDGAILQESVHEGTIRDGESFVMLDWDAQAGGVRMVPHGRYTDATVGGDNFGCKAHYPDDNTDLPMEYASKRWVEDLGNGKARQRLNLYYADRIEKYEVLGGGQLRPLRDEVDTAWPLPWVDGTGAPLGIPVVHFLNTPDARPEAWDVIGPQKAINKTLIDTVATADSTAFQVLVALGWFPTSDGLPLKADGSNAARIAPGMVLGTTKSKADADLKAIGAGDVRPLIELMISLIGWVAVVSSTPAARLSFTRQVAAEGTLKEQNEGLFAKVRKRQKRINAGWVRCLEMGRRLANVFGAAGLDEGVRFDLVWEPVQSRDTEDERDEWRAKREMGVPLEQIWTEMGYSLAQVERMKASPEYQARLAMLEVGLAGDAG
jgi:hypothetical protein